MSDFKYRKDIDGLRAIAILPVLLFHAGYTGFSGGYVGVDIFFVISGYLITKILVKDINNGTYSLITFYERRVRRIIPALVSVIFFVIIASPFFLPPDNYAFLPKEIIGTLFFASNIVSYLKSGYFSTDAEQRPLLHTWSLGIEEQFYIVSPIILFLVLKYYKNWLGSIVSVITIVSFILCLHLTKNHPSFSFYLLPTRYWELSFGALAAIGVIKKPNNKILIEVLSFIGLFLIAYSVFTFNAETIFPGYMALIPVLGATLLIVNAESTVVGRFLSLKPIVFIGLISYSLYLWHWPLIVFSKDKYIIDMSLSKEVVVVISIFLAWISTKYIEAPFRSKSKYTQRKIFKHSILMYSIVFALSMIMLPLNGWSNRLSKEKQNILYAVNDFSPIREHCHFNGGLPTIDKYCELRNRNNNTQVVLWGDSHGAEIGYSLSKMINLYAITYSACPPALGYFSPDRPQCLPHNKNVLNFILNNKSIKTVVLAANYNLYYKSHDANAFAKDFKSTITTLVESGRDVLILDQIPNPGVNVPHYLTNTSTVKNETFEYDGSNFEKLNLNESLKVFHYEKYMCDNNLCSMIYNGEPISFDDNHLSLQASKYISGYVYNEIAIK